MFRNWTSGDLASGNPGFNFSLTQTPVWGVGPNGVGKAGIWSTAMSLITSKVLRSVEIPGLVEVLKAAVVAP